MVLCLLTLLDSGSYFAPYLIAGLAAFYCLLKNRTDGTDRKYRTPRSIIIVSFIAAVFITLANHKIWLHPVMPDIRSAMFVRICKLLLVLILMSGVYVIVLNILVFIRHDPEKIMFTPSEESSKSKLFFFCIPFTAMLIIYMTIYLCCYYPGILSVDSIDQIGQFFTGQYSNHHPFYHSVVIGLFLRAGLAVFGNINSAVAGFIIVQIIFMVTVFSFVIYNMAVLGLPRWVLVATSIWYCVMPFHFMYSFTLWKDVPFGAFVACLITFFIRIMTRKGNMRLNYIGFSVCGPFICLFRSNGMFAYVFVFLALILLARKQKKLLIITGMTILVCLILKYGVLKLFSVTPPDTVESLSIPLQQVARVIAEDGFIEDGDRALISQIIDIDSAKESYDPTISDPIKNLIRDFGNQDHLSQNMSAYAGVYLRTLSHNPMTYVIAWVDSTCGYWNSGYDYWVWYWDVQENPYGITRTIRSEGVLHAMDEYLWLYYNNTVLQLLTSIGLAVWILLILLAVSLFTGNRTATLSTIPILAIILSLLISSPVFSEFRYMYALFCSLPMIMAITLGSLETKNREGSDEDNV
ncbi:MAG: hypothetical protein J5910_09870 [Lachnospiraceae bacterium]|nr:hypothetical protein [Lachnospiraceae bacterium]